MQATIAQQHTTIAQQQLDAQRTDTFEKLLKDYNRAAVYLRDQQKRLGCKYPEAAWEPGMEDVKDKMLKYLYVRMVIQSSSY
jgi:hypothetical protein